MTNEIEMNYDINDKSSIIEYAKKLIGKSLREFCSDNELTSSRLGKGGFGQFLEEFYFGYKPNSSSEPDFAAAGMELKSSPLKRLKSSEYRSKERLVLNIINYVNVVNQTFENSDFVKKNNCLLLVFYLYSPSCKFIDYVVKLVGEWTFSDVDLQIIKKDWETINNKIKDGRADELSEGDTFYLAACTKGANSKTLRIQPNSNTLAKQRAYCFKQGYVNHIIASLAGDLNEVYGKFMSKTAVEKEQTIEDVVLNKFSQYYNQSIGEILRSLGLAINTSAKNFFANLTKAILGIELNKKIEEFEKADIIVKTVRLLENGLPKEHVSFPSFSYQGIVNETWEESNLKGIFERKFLFVFFQYQGTNLILRKVKFWNMPFADINEAKKVWKKTKEVVESGEIVSRIFKGIRATNFPKPDYNPVAHVRPHAKNSLDVYPLPVKDRLTNSLSYTKHSFWLNREYVRDEIYLK